MIFKPVDSKGSPMGKLVDDIDDGAPGDFSFYSDSQGEDAGILFRCPCGCPGFTAANFRAGERPAWQWDGNREKPTMRPSMLIYQLDERGKIIGEHWHGWLTAGQWISC